MTTRREWVKLCATSALLAPLPSFAGEAEKRPIVGYVGQNFSVSFDLFQRQLRESGYVEGNNIRFDRRESDGDREKILKQVSDLVRLRVRVLVATNNIAIEAARKATTAIPVVMVTSIDPVTAGFVETLAHPGGNITGVANLLRELSAKRIEMLREVFPKLSRLAVIWSEDGPGPKVAFHSYSTAAEALKIGMRSLPVRGARPDLEGAFKAARAAGAEVMIVVASPNTGTHRASAMALSLQYRIPSMVETESWVSEGALMSYGASVEEVSRRVAIFVRRILQGAKPADLPVEQPTKVELVVNLKTAKTLGITFPQSILVRANRVIE